MPLVTPGPGDTTFLWKLNMKINGPVKGFNMKLWLQGKTPADAIAAGNDIAGRLKYIMPADSEIFSAVISKDDSKRDSKMLETAAGPGLYNVATPVVTPSSCDTDEAALLIRFEHSDGASNTMKFCPLPDNVITKRAIISTFALAASYTTPVAAPAAPTLITDWVVNFGGLIGAILFYSAHVSSPHTSGGPYNWSPWLKAIPLRVGRKKGGRAFA
jgi:hypothetical protein